MNTEKRRGLILLSLDVSISSTGYAIFEENDLVTYGKIITKKKDFETEDLRINYICDIIKEITIEYSIDKLVCEEQFAGINQSTILLLRKLIGAIMRTVNEYGISIKYYYPVQWRKILNINKGKDKKELAYNYLADNNIINFEFKPKGANKNDDICDAICIGIAYLKDKEREQNVL